MLRAGSMRRRTISMFPFNHPRDKMRKPQIVVTREEFSAVGFFKRSFCTEAKAKEGPRGEGVMLQGTEIQLGLAVQSQNATLPVKRRLACEQLSFFTQGYFCLSEADDIAAGKELLYIKWKHLEAKAASYYYHGLILDKGTEPSSHVSAVCCFVAAQELLAQSKKACLTFCLADPVTRASPPWGAMKHLHEKIPDIAFNKYQMYGDLLDQEKGLQTLPDLPEFELSLKPGDYELPEMDPGWDCGKWDIPGQSLKEHLNDQTQI